MPITWIFVCETAARDQNWNEAVMGCGAERSYSHYAYTTSSAEGSLAAADDGRKRSKAGVSIRPDDFCTIR